MWEQWEKDAAELRQDYSRFREYFERNKKCRCDIANCKHFGRAAAEVLEPRATKICSQIFDIGLRSFYDMKNDV